MCLYTRYYRRPPSDRYERRKRQRNHSDIDGSSSFTFFVVGILAVDTIFMYYGLFENAHHCAIRWRYFLLGVHTINVSFTSQQIQASTHFNLGNVFRIIKMYRLICVISLLYQRRNFIKDECDEIKSDSIIFYFKKLFNIIISTKNVP